IAWTGVLIFVGGVSFGLIYGVIITRGQVLGGIIMLSFILGLVLLAILALYREKLIIESRKVKLAAAPSRFNKKTWKVLNESTAEVLQNNTEQTTALIEQERSQVEAPHRSAQRLSGVSEEQQ